MCEIVVTRGFILLLLGEAKTESEIEFFSKCLAAISVKLRQIFSNQTQLYLSYIPQDISPYKQDDPIALEWELISEAEECSSHLCDRMCAGSRDAKVTSLSLPQLTSVVHGLLDEGTSKLGGGVLLDLIVMLSSSGVDQLIEGQDALGMYGALERVGWQNGHVTVVHCLQIKSHLLISPAVHTSVVMSEDEKLDCIDENLFWRGVFIADFNAFDNSGREEQIKHMCISKEPKSVAREKCDEKKSLFRKKKVSRKKRKVESPLMILLVKEMAQDNFPLILLHAGPIKLYSLDKQGQLALKNMRLRLSSVVGEDGCGAFILLALVSCHLDTPLLVDSWYEYIIGKQPHWINSVKIEMRSTPNYSLFPQPAVTEGALFIFEFKQENIIPDEVIEGSIAQREEDSSEEDFSLPEEISVPVLNEKQLYTMCNIWKELLDLQVPTDADSLSDELISKVDNILLDMPIPSFTTISTVPPPTEPDSAKDLKDTLEYKIFSGLDRYSQMMEKPKKPPARRLGGLSPPPMSQSSSKMGVDSLLDCFDSEGRAVRNLELEEVPIPVSLDRKQMKERLFSNAIDGEDANQSYIQHSWDRCQTQFVKHETRGLMNYQSPPKSRLAKSLFPSKPKSNKPIPVPLNFSGLNISNDKCDESVSVVKVRSSSKTCTKTSKAKVKVRVNKSMTEVRAKKRSGKKESRDKELRGLLERAVVKALKGENLIRDHPQFKAAYTQLFNVCKCFLSGMEFETAKERVEQLAVNNAKQVVELQTKS